MKIAEVGKFIATYKVFCKVTEDAYEKDKKQVDANYNQNTALYQKMIDGIRQKADEKITEAMEKTMVKVDKAFADANSDLDEYVVSPMSQEQNTVLGILNNLKDTGISKQEADLYYRQIQNNYTAKRMGIPMLKKASGKDFAFITYGEVKDHLDRVEKQVRAWLVNTDLTSYDSISFSANYERDLKNCDDHIEAFKTGSDYSEIDYASDPEETKLNEMMQQLENQENAKKNAERDRIEKAIFGGKA